MFLGDWSAKGQELHLCEHCRFHLMSLKLILKDRMNQLIVITSAAKLNFNQIHHNCRVRHYYQSKP